MKVIRYILLAVNVLAAIGLVLTTLAGDVAPTTSLVPSVLAYAFLPMLAVNVVFFLGWLLARRWQCLVSGAAVALRFSFVGLFLQVGGRSDVPPIDECPGRVSLMTYNVHGFSGTALEVSVKDSVARQFVELVREADADVLCLQEYPLTRGVRVTDSLQQLGYNHHYGSRGNPGAPKGTVVFSRLPITYVKRIDPQKVLVDVLKDSVTVRICCVHMGSFNFNLSDREEVERMGRGLVDSTSHGPLRKAKQTVLTHAKEWDEQLRPIVGECSVPLVVAGDMKDIPSSWLYARLADKLHDAYRDEGSGMSVTFNGGNGRVVPIGRGWFPEFRIDMVFLSDDLQTLSYRRLRSDVSDHYPVLVSFQPAKR